MEAYRQLDSVKELPLVGLNGTEGRTGSATDHTVREGGETIRIVQRAMLLSLGAICGE
jgi:hypothetical protein